MMKRVLGTVAALAVAASAHAQLSGETTSGTELGSPTGSAFDVVFNIDTATTPIGPLTPYVGGGTLDFTLSKAADVSFAGITGSPSATGVLSGTGLAPFIVFNYTSATTTTTIDLGPGSYVYTAGAYSFAPSNLIVDIHAVTAVPEPESYAMLLAGLAVTGGVVLRRRRRDIGLQLAV